MIMFMGFGSTPAYLLFLVKIQYHAADCLNVDMKQDFYTKNGEKKLCIGLCWITDTF